MAGFFSLGGGGGSSRGTSSNNNNTSYNPQDPNHPNEISPETLFFYTRNQENSLPYNKGTFELWQYPPAPQLSSHQQQQQLHPHPHPHHHHHHHRQNPLMLQDLYSLAIGSTSRGVGGGGGASGMSIYEDQSSSRSDQAFVMMGSSTTSSGAAGSTGNICCQDCGNQAKKDCVHMRCRSCCKSRGFECTTHVKSTWVPAAKRRERHQQIASMLEQQQQQEEEEQKLQMNNITGSSSGRDQQNRKRVKENNTSSRLPTSNRPSGLELANLPAEVNTSAVFRCVRVSSIDNSEDQYAYQTALSIGGHTFKGILYDQGPEAQYLAGDTSSGGSGNIPQLHLTTATSTSSPATTTLLDNSLYPNSYMAGTNFFHQPPRS